MNKGIKQLLPTERLYKIKEILGEKEAIRITDLTDELGVSVMTIRRDLETLEKRGVLERTHGGAVLNNRMESLPIYSSGVLEMVEEKNAIARKAAEFVSPNDTIFIGPGTTAARLLHYIDPGMDLLVVSNNLGALHGAHGKKLKFVLVGGFFQESANSLTGSYAEKMLLNFNCNKLFIGADGISLKSGVTTPDPAEASIVDAMMQQTSGKIVLLSDNSKFGKVASFAVVPLEKIDLIITDQGVSEKYRESIEERGRELLIA
jgi:DeoR family transcriptional regulator, fructose operon transcriptional repressor